jgi:hypothetical protein
MTSPPTNPKQGREALEDIERRFSRLLGRLGQTFEEALSALPEATPQTRSRSFVGTVEEFLAARRGNHETPEAQTPADGAATDAAAADARTPPESPDPAVTGGKVTLAFGDRPAVEIDLPEIRIGAAWRVSVGGGTLRFDPD